MAERKHSQLAVNEVKEANTEESDHVIYVAAIEHCVDEQSRNQERRRVVKINPYCGFVDNARTWASSLNVRTF